MKILMAIAISASIITGFGAFATEENMDHTDMPPCQGKPIEKQCKALFRIVGYTFDADSKTCKPFRAGGCGMTGNGFRSMEECQSKCKLKPKKEGEFCGRCFSGWCPKSCTANTPDPRVGDCGECEEELECEQVSPLREPPGKCSRTDVPTPKCYIGGCSAHICSAKSGLISTCEWKPSYGCKDHTTCEYYKGECQWVPNKAYLACMAAAVSQPKKEGEFCGRCLHTDCPDSCPRGICGKCEEGLVCKEDFLVIPYKRSPVANPLGKCVNQTVSKPKKEGEFCGPCYGAECPDSCPPMVMRNGIKKSEPPTKVGQCGKCEKGLVCLPFSPWIRYATQSRKMMPYPLNKCVNRTVFNPKKEGEFCGDCLGEKCPDSCERRVDYEGITSCGKCDKGLFCKRDFQTTMRNQSRRRSIRYPLGKCVNLTATECKNKLTDKQCKKIKKAKKCNKEKGMKECKKTCGLCDDGKCKNDKNDRECKKMKKNCKDPEVMKDCKKTCGLCDDGKCKNNKTDKQCKKMKKNCKDPEVMKDCKKTCRLCDDGKCKNNKQDKACMKLRKRCEEPKVMKNCKKTCGLCDDGMADF